MAHGKPYDSGRHATRVARRDLRGTVGARPARDLAEVCVYLGLEPQREYEDPFSSKRRYVRTRLLSKIDRRAG